MPANLIKFKLISEIKEKKTMLHFHVGTLSHTKKLFPILIANLLFNRMEYEEYFFESHKLLQLQYVKFCCSMIPKAHSLYYVQTMLADIGDNLNLKLLKTFTIKIFDKRHNKKLETYTFSFNYVGSENYETPKPTTQQIVASTIKLLQTLRNFSLKTKHADEDVYVEIEPMLQ